MLENASMSLLLDVLEVLACLSIGRVLLAHVAKTAGVLRESLPIGALAEPADLQMIRLQKDGTREECYYWFSVVQEFLREKETAGGRKLR